MHKYMETKQHTLKTPSGSKNKSQKVRKYLEKNENENRAQQNVWGTVKVALRWKFIAVNTLKKKDLISTM